MIQVTGHEQAVQLAGRILVGVSAVLRIEACCLLTMMGEELPPWQQLESDLFQRMVVSFR